MITSYGNMFTCSTVASADLKYAANIGYSYIDLVSYDDAGYLYALGNQTIKKLLITGQYDLFLKSTIDLSGNQTSCRSMVITGRQAHEEDFAGNLTRDHDS